MNITQNSTNLHILGISLEVVMNIIVIRVPSIEKWHEKIDKKTSHVKS